MKRNLLVYALLPLVIMSLLCASAPPAQSGEIWGHLYDPDGFHVYHVAITANIAGDNTSGHGLGEATNEAPNWLYWIPNLPGGTYSLGAAEWDFYSRQYFSGFNVPGTGSVGKHWYYKPNAFIAGTTWFGPGCSEYRQSFTASGSSVISVALREAAGVEMRATIHQGDVQPLGPQIGPARVIPSSHVNGRAGYWSAGDVSTTPGELYTVKIVANSPSGIWPFIETIKKGGGTRIPTGRSWRQGAIVNEAPELVISSDDDGIITTVCTARDYNHIWGTNVGQSFKAKGRSVVGVTFKSGSNNVYAVSIHNGVGSGNGGPQIGPTKYVRAISWNNRTAVTWAPGEVMVTPGNTYFVRFRHLDGSGVTLYTTQGSPVGSNMYSVGHLYKDSVAMPDIDLSITVMEEESAGSINRPFNSINNLSVTTTPTTATLTWYTNPSLNGRVDWSEGTTPYTHSHTTPTASTSHNVTLTDLEPNTKYHYRVGGVAAGYRELTSEDTVFVTPPMPGTNLLTNPGFESGNLNGWTMYGQGIDVRNIPSSGGEPWFYGARARTGSYFLGGAGNGTQVLGGVYQRVSAIPGVKMKAGMWLWTYSDGNFRSEDAQAWGRIGIDPTGGTNPNSSNIIWTTRASAQQRYIGLGLEVTAQSDHVTVFCNAGVSGLSGYQWTVFAIDDVALTSEVIHTEMPLSDAKVAADGTLVKVSDLIVSGTPAVAGAYYAQQLDRAAGIRIESTGTAAVGEKVSLTGTMGTKPSGERFIADAHFASRTAVGGPTPIGTATSNIGGLVQSTNNVGLLMITWGEVTSSGTDYVTINDGSLPGNGLKVITTSLPSPPTQGKMAVVLGIVQLEGLSSSPKVVIHPRRRADVKEYDR